MRKLRAKVCSFIILCSVVMLCACGGEQSNTSQTGSDLNTVQRISYDATDEYSDAISKYNNGCEPSVIIRDEEDYEKKEIALVLQGMPDRVTIEKVLELLEERDMKVAFSITAMEAAEDDETFQLIHKKGHEIVNNGLNGESAMESLSDEELIYSFTHSRKVFSTLLNIPCNKLMLNSTYYTDGLCVAANASGFDKLVAPSSGHYINVRSFKDEEKAGEYINRLDNGTILVVKLNGYIDSLEFEPKEEAKKPAKDFKAEAVTYTVEEEQEDDIIKTLTWMLDAIDAEDIKLTSLDSLKAQTAQEYAEELFEKNSGLKADCYSDVSTMEDVIGLAFYGVPSIDTTKQVVQLLQDNESNATFFVRGSDFDENAESIALLAKEGFSISTAGGSGENMVGRDVKDTYLEILLGKRAVQKNVSLRAKYYMPVEKIDDDMLLAARVAGVDVVLPKASNNIEKGAIKLIRCDASFEASELSDFITSANKQKMEICDISSLLETANQVPDIDEETLAKLREDNEGKLAQEKTYVYTSEKAMSMLFYGVANKKVTEDVLAILAEKNYKATFFVTMDDMINCSEQINEIIENGHEIGIAYIDNAKTPGEFDSVVKYIMGAQKYLEWKYDAQGSLVKQPYGEVADETKEAISATGCTLVGHEYTMVQSKDVDAEKPSDFYGKYGSKINVHRGSVAFFNMNYYSADKSLADDANETLLGGLVRMFIRNEIDSMIYKDVYGQYQPSTAYTVKSYSALSKSAYAYVPGRVGQSKVAMDKNVLTNMASEEEQSNYILSRYYGNPNVTTVPGFTEAEDRKMNRAGKVSGDNVICLTFDDWGYDSNVNALLYVLNKYNVKATFFIRTNNVSNNGNLLRAIAVDGHAIASHTDTHMVLSNFRDDITDSYVYESLSEEQAMALRKDIVRSYNTLNRYVGDVSVNGRPSLTTLFRSPTLAVSKIGMYQVFDVGYSYIVSGDISTNDYAAGSVDELVGLLRNGKTSWEGQRTIGAGSCVVMHMSPDAKFTAEALDIMIPEWQAQGYNFARVDDYLR